jgi:sugar/nucleoside kinase (ribokinase family)
VPAPRWPFEDELNATVEDRPVDVLCVGNALIDRLAWVADAEAVRRAGMEPGVMTLIDGERAAAIEASMSGWHEVAGGCAANTASGIASLGGSPAFVGSIGEEASTRWYPDDLAAQGVRCTLSIAASGQATGTCHVLVTADGQRSMATHLGAASELPPKTVEEAGIGAARVAYLEGYLLDVPAVARTAERTFELARSAGTLVSLSLSDPFVVSRHRRLIADLLSSGSVDLVFGNETEMLELTGAASRTDGLTELASLVPAAVMTLGAEGAVVAVGHETAFVAAYPAERVDTTGAGDLFAAGCLYGLTHGLPPEQALQVGAFAASEVISHLGARPAVSLREALPASYLQPAS